MIRPHGHPTDCECTFCFIPQWTEQVGRFNIFTDMEIGHLYAVLRPGRMLAEVTAEVERRRKYYEDLEVAQAEHTTCDGCSSFNRDDLSIAVIAGVNIYYCPSCYETWQTYGGT